jgi:hypothetical protein
MSSIVKIIQSVTIYDNNGKIIQIIDKPDGNVLSINLADYATATYLIEIIDAENISYKQSFKVVK